MEGVIENDLIFNLVSLIDFFVQLITTPDLQVDHLVTALEAVGGLVQMTPIHIFNPIQVTILGRRTVNPVKDTHSLSRVQVELEVIQCLVKPCSTILNLSSVVLIFIFFSLNLVKNLLHYSRLGRGIL